VNGKRLKLVSILAGVVLAGVGLLAWTQPWFDLVVDSPQGGTLDLVAAGDVAAAPLSALSLAVLASAGALTIAGRVFRVVLGALQVLLGASVATTASVALGDPVRAAGSAVTDATGVDGAESLHQLVASAAATPWPVVALVAGVLTALLGASVVVLSGAWPGAGRRYTATRLVAVDPAGDPAAAWDSLSGGDDPTDDAERPADGGPATGQEPSR